MVRKLKFHSYLSVISAIMLSTANSAHAEDANEHALALIEETAAKICQVAPLTQQNSQVVLSGNAKANVNGIISKLADIGIDGAAKYTNTTSYNVLQQDLITAIKDGNNCKLQVFNKLIDKLLNTTSSPATVHGSAPSVNGISLGTDENSVSSLISFGSPPTYSTSSTIKMGVGFSEKLVKFDVYYDTEGGKVSKIKLEHHASVNCATNFGKSALDEAVRRFGHPRTEPIVSTNSFSTDYKYFFDDGRFQEFLTINEKLLSPGNTVPWCKVEIEYRSSS